MFSSYIYCYGFQFFKINTHLLTVLEIISIISCGIYNFEQFININSMCYKIRYDIYF